MGLSLADFEGVFGTYFLFRSIHADAPAKRIRNRTCKNVVNERPCTSATRCLYLKVEVVGHSCTLGKHICRFLHLRLSAVHGTELIQGERWHVCIVLQLAFKFNRCVQCRHAVGVESKAAESCPPQQQWHGSLVMAF